MSVSRISSLARKRFEKLLFLIQITLEFLSILFEDCSICGIYLKKKILQMTSFTVRDQVKTHEHEQILIYLNGGKQI